MVSQSIHSLSPSFLSPIFLWCFLHYAAQTMSKVISCSFSVLSQTFNGGDVDSPVLGLVSGKEIFQ